MDKRRARRTPIAVEVSLETAHNFYAGISEDVSYGGVFVVTDEPPPPGSEVRVLITVPGGVVRAHGSVRWVRPPHLASPDCPPGCGVSWQAMDRRSRNAVKRFLARRELPAVVQPKASAA